MLMVGITVGMPVVEYTVGMLVGTSDGRAEAGLIEGVRDRVVVGRRVGCAILALNDGTVVGKVVSLTVGAVLLG